MANRGHIVLFALVSVACGRPRVTAIDGGTTTVASTASGSESSGSGTSGSTSTSESTTTSESTSGDSSVPDVPDLSCDILKQDCPEGEKCVPRGWGGPYECVPVLGDQQPGESCVYIDESAGTEDCDATSYCWDGTCLSFCIGTYDDPDCPNPPGCNDSVCLTTDETSLYLCEPIACDPIAQDCGEGLACYWVTDTFRCVVPSANFSIGEPCDFLHECGVGTDCVAAELLPSCADPSCCAPYCDPGAMIDPCPDLLPGTSCVPFDEAGVEQPGCIVGRCLAGP